MLRHGQDLDAHGLCDAGLAHRVELWVGEDGEPAASPIGVVGQDVPAAAGEEPRVVRVDLDLPLEVTDGEFVVLAVQMTGDEDGALRLRWCADAMHPDRNWWSYAEEPPYAWGFFPSEGDIEATLYVEGSR